MSKSNAEVTALKDQAFELVATSRKRLQSGAVDLAPVETGVRNFCEALAAMPLEDARPFAQDLHALSEEMNLLERDLKQSRDAVQQQLAELGRHNKAQVAYKKTDGIGEKFFAPDAEDKP